MKRVLFVAHRFGYLGGTEQTMFRYANTAASMGYDVGVYAPAIRINKDRLHSGKLDGVTVTNDVNIIYEPWDLIVVHGDGDGQNHVHHSQREVGGPVFYLLCRPEEQNQAVFQTMLMGMRKAKWVGCATSADFKFAEKHGFGDKVRDIRGYPIECLPEITKTPEDIRRKFGITLPKVYISTGGFWPHKQFEQIAESFCKLKLPDVELILTGYDVRNGVAAYGDMARTAGVKITPCFIYDSTAVYELMSVADLYIWNSKPGSEGFGLVLLESMYYNLPWIGTDTAAAYDLAGRGGVAYDSRDIMESAMRNPPQKQDAAGALKLREFVDQYSTKNLLPLLLGVLYE